MNKLVISISLATFLSVSWVTAASSTTTAYPIPDAYGSVAAAVNFDSVATYYDMSQSAGTTQHAFILGPDGTFAQSSTSTTQGGSLIAIVGQLPGGYYGASASSTLNYDFEIVSPVNSYVPVDIRFNNTVSTAGGGNGESATSIGLADGPSFLNEACYDISFCYDSQTSSQNIAGMFGELPGFVAAYTDWHVLVPTNSLNTVSMNAFVLTYFVGGHSLTAFADPLISINPSYYATGQYTLLESPGIQNYASGAPEPDVWALLLVGIGSLGVVLRQRGGARRNVQRD